MVSSQFQFIELAEDASDEGVGIGHAPRIMTTNLQSEVGVGVRVALPAVVFHKLPDPCQVVLPDGLKGCGVGAALP